jgi:hypothetical protein
MMHAYLDGSRSSLNKTGDESSHKKGSELHDGIVELRAAGKKEFMYATYIPVSGG